MKKELIMFFILINIVQINARLELTPMLSQQTGFRKRMLRLRVKAQNHLDSIQRHMNSVSAKVKSGGRIVLGDYLERRFANTYNMFSHRFDSLFVQYDRLVVMQGDYLDFNDAPNSEKIKLLESTEKAAGKQLDRLIKESIDYVNREYNTLDN